MVKVSVVQYCKDVNLSQKGISKNCLKNRISCLYHKEYSPFCINFFQHDKNAHFLNNFIQTPETEITILARSPKALNTREVSLSLSVSVTSSRLTEPAETGPFISRPYDRLGKRLPYQRSTFRTNSVMLDFRIRHPEVTTMI